MGEIGGEIGKERILGGLLKTGQTTQYGGYEDDGYFEKGLSSLYTVLTLGQYAGTTSITLNSKTDAHSNNCVYDRRTKLTWSRYAAGSVGPASNGKLPWTTNVNGEGIYPFVAAANLALLGGYGDWRVANRKELDSLFNIELNPGTPDTTAFPSWPTSGTWASSTTKEAANAAFLSGYNYVSALEVRAKTEAYTCILVRGG